MNNLNTAFSPTRFWSNYLGVLFIVFFVFSLFYLIMGMPGMVIVVMSAFFYLLPGIFLIKYASTIKQGELTNDISTWETACRRQAGFMRYIGILCAIFVVLFIGIIVSAAIPAYMDYIERTQQF